jgi:hypothetical protein
MAAGGFLFQGGKPPLSTVVNPPGAFRPNWGLFEGGTKSGPSAGVPASYRSVDGSRPPCLEYPCVAATNKCLAQNNKSRTRVFGD